MHFLDPLPPSGKDARTAALPMLLFQPDRRLCCVPYSDFSDRDSIYENQWPCLSESLLEQHKGEWTDCLGSAASSLTRHIAFLCPTPEFRQLQETFRVPCGRTTVLSTEWALRAVPLTAHAK